MLVITEKAGLKVMIVFSQDLDGGVDLHYTVRAEQHIHTSQEKRIFKNHDNCILDRAVVSQRYFLVQAFNEYQLMIW